MPDIVPDIVNVTLWDSGHWGGGRFSEPRIFSALKLLELTSGGRIRIEEMRYVQTTDELSSRLPKEPERAYTLREEKRHAIHFARVQNTARFFKYEFQEEEDLETLHPITPEGRQQLFVVVMPPCEERSRLITSLLGLDIEASLVIAPAVFEDNLELKRFIDEESRSNDEESRSNRIKIIPFVPFRYSHSMLTLAALNKSKPTELIEASILAGKYPSMFPIFRISSQKLVREFSAPVLDCVVHAAGRAVEGSIIFKEAQRSPCILINAVHENQVVSSIHISAISKFQQINLNFTAFFSGSRLSFSDAFRDTVHYDGDVILTESSRGHDAIIEERNGYTKLLSDIINLPKNDLPKNDLPTLPSFSNTQTLIDLIFASISRMQEKSQAHITFQDVAGTYHISG